MNTSVVRRVARVWPAAWRLAAAGWLVAIWWVLVLAAGASANDCLEYIKNLKNFVNIPKGLLEDCMRTGVVQAGTTAAVGSIGGGVIAVAVTKALKGKPPGPDTPDYREGKEGTPKENPFDPSDDERRRKWNQEKVVWDPQLLGWRSPRPEEYPPPDRPPEDAPPYQRQNPREKTPPECLALYDEYVKAQADLLTLEPELQRLAQEYRQVTDWLNIKKTLVTLQLGKDMTDLVFAGTGSVRLARPVTKLVTALPDALRGARTKLAAIVARRTNLLADLADLGGRSAQMGRMLATMGDLAKNAIKHVDEINELLGAASDRLKLARGALTFVNQIDDAVLQRDAIVRRVSAAEAELKEARAAAAKARARKAAIDEQDARAFAGKHDDLSQARKRLEALKAKNPQAVEHARQLWQAKQEAAAAVNKAAERLRQLKYRAESTKQVMGDAATVVDHHKAKLQRHLDGPVAQLEARRARLEELRQQKIPDPQAVRDAAARVEKARQAVLDYDPRKPLDPASLPPDVRAGRQALVDAQVAAEQESAAAAKALREYDLAQNRRIRQGLEPERPINVDDAEWYAGVPEYERARMAQGRLRDAERDVVAFDQAHLENVAEAADSELKAVRQGIDKEYLDAKAALDREATTLQQQTRQLEGDVTRAEQQHAHAQRGHHEAVDALERSDIEHLPELEADHRRLRTEAENLRASYERLRDGTFTDPEEAARVGARITQLEEELRNFDQQRAALRDGPGPKELADEAAAAEQRVAELEPKVQELARQESALEKQIGEMRDRLPPGSTRQVLEEEASLAEAEIERRRSDLETAKAKASEAQAKETEAAANAKRADMERTAKDAELEQVKKDEAAAQDELNTLERGANPAGEGLAGSGQHLRPPGDGGGDPALGEYQDLVRRSGQLSEQYKPDWARGTEQLLKDGLQKIGKKWEQAFDGQSMEDMVNGIEKTNSRLAKIEQELNAKREEYDRIRGDNGAKLQQLKEQLDACITSHTFWQGSETPQGGS